MSNSKKTERFVHALEKYGVEAFAKRYPEYDYTMFVENAPPQQEQAQAFFDVNKRAGRPITNMLLTKLIHGLNRQDAPMPVSVMPKGQQFCPSSVLPTYKRKRAKEEPEQQLHVSQIQVNNGQLRKRIAAIEENLESCNEQLRKRIRAMEENVQELKQELHAQEEKVATLCG